MKYSVLLCIVIASFLSALFIVPSKPVDASVTYSCPEGQAQALTNGQLVSGHDPRYCYSKTYQRGVCPAGQTRGTGDRLTGGLDRDRCYERDGTNGGILATPRFKDMGEVPMQEQLKKGARVTVTNHDGMKCPSPSYRGGIISSQDSSKCYTCSAGGCQVISGQDLVPVHYEACLDADRACIRAQEEAQEKYMEGIRASAPRGFTLPDAGEEVRSATIARMFCEYYKKMEWITQYDTEYTFEACIIGYEVGFGKGDICSKPYLFGHYATHRPAPTAQAERAHEYIKDKKRAVRDLVINDAIKACLDGWAQYSTDYWWCEGRGNCLDLLRDDSSRIIDPGPRPNKKQYINEDGDAVEVSTNVVTSQSCGSVQTAFFACNLGQGLQNSSFWQIIQMILNILIGLVGIGAVGGLVYGAARYSSAGDNAEQVKAAKTIIKNVIIGLVLFLMMWAFIQYVIPGGIFS